jgi:hypothetical protein
MAIEPVSIAAIIMSSLTAVGGLLAGLHIKRMNSGCCSCEASNPDSPARRKSKQENDPVFVLQPAPQGHPNLTTV